MKILIANVPGPTPGRKAPTTWCSNAWAGLLVLSVITHILAIIVAGIFIDSPVLRLPIGWRPDLVSFGGPVPYSRFEWTLPAFLLPAALIAALSLWLWRFTRSRPLVGFGVMWFALLLAPMSGFVRIGEYGLANRYLYLPIVGLAIILCGMIILEGAVGGAIVIFTAAALAALSSQHVMHWSDTDALFRWTLRTDPQNLLARRFLYHEAIRRGELKKAQQYVLTPRAVRASENGLISMWGAYFLKRPSLEH